MLSVRKAILVFSVVLPAVLAEFAAPAVQAASSLQPIRSGRPKLWAEEVQEAITDGGLRKRGANPAGDGSGRRADPRGRGPHAVQDPAAATGSTGNGPSGRDSRGPADPSSGRGSAQGGPASGHPGRGSGEGAAGHGNAGRGADHGGRGGGHGPSVSR